jgi:NAD(P)-dependent dehydrogenase (short-subunit alcohol dehydrogenase family)
MSRLEGNVAVFSGGNSGIGLAIAQRFVKEGATCSSSAGAAKRSTRR